MTGPRPDWAPTTREAVAALVFFGAIASGIAAVGIAHYDGPDAVGFLMVGLAGVILLLGGTALAVFRRHDD